MRILSAMIFMWSYYLTVYGHPGHEHHDHGNENSSVIESISEYLESYQTSTLALIGTLIVQSVPVILMSVIYNFLDKYVKDTSNSKLLSSMYSFTFGALMGDVLLHLLPSLYYEIQVKEYETEEEHRFAMLYVNGFIFVGIVICYSIEVIINNYFHIGHDHHNHDSKDHIQKENSNKSSALIAVAFLGDMFHNFTDGLAIASTFMLNRKLGIATVIAWFFHEIPHEIGDFTFMFKNNCSYFKALSYQLMTGCGAIIGTYFWLTFASKATVEMAAIAGGTFIYLSMWMFMEDLRKSNRLVEALLNVILMLFGFIFMLYLS